MNKTNTATSGKLIKAVYVSYGYVYVFCTMDSLRKQKISCYYRESNSSLPCSLTAVSQLCYVQCWGTKDLL